MTKFEKQKNKWEKQKAKGKTKYVLFDMLIFLTGAVITATLDILIFNCEYLNHLNRLVIHYIIFMAFLGLAGLISGNISWHINFKKFKE